MTGFEFHMILTEWCNKYPYREFKDTAGQHMFVLAATEFGALTAAIREKVEIPKRQAWLSARTAYIWELAAEGKEDYQIADAVDLDDLQQVRLLMMTAKERASGLRVCTDELPGIDCGSSRHHPNCRYARVDD